jgi:pilus assembly protein Flp/PilA
LDEKSARTEEPMPHALTRSLLARLSDEKGQALVEYGLILALIAVFLLAALGFVSNNLATLFTKIATTL